MNRFLKRVKILLSLISMSSTPVFCQQILAQLDVDKEFIKNTSELLFLESSRSPVQRILLIGTKEKVLPFVVGANFEVNPLSTIALPDLSPHKDLIGGVHLGSKSLLVYSDSKKNDFASIVIDYESRKAVKSFIGLKKGEVYLASFQLDSSFFIVTTFWNKSTINFYEVSVQNGFVFHEVNLKDFKLREKNFFESLLRGTREPELTKISYETINSLEGTHSRNKLYYFGGSCFVTLDYDGWRTYILEINLKDWSVTLKKIGNLKSKNVIKSNSYLFFSELFRAELTSDSLRISVFDLESGKNKAEFVAYEKDDIFFKNGSIIQEGGATIFSPDERELNKTKTLFRKISNGDIAISVSGPLNQDSALCVTVGSVKTIVNSGRVSSFGSPGVSTPTFGGTFASTTSPTFNPTYYGYQNYSWSKTAYFQSRLSVNLNHLPGKIEENDFDKMKKYLDDDAKNIPGTDILMSDILLKTIFQSENRFYAAIYSKKREKLIVIRP